MNSHGHFALIVAEGGACLFPFPGCPAAPVYVPDLDASGPVWDVLRRWRRHGVILLADGADVLLCRQSVPLVPRGEQDALIHDRLRMIFPYAFRTQAQPAGMPEADGTRSWLFAGIASDGPAQRWMQALERAGGRCAGIGLAPVEWARLAARLEPTKSDLMVVACTQASGMMRMIFSRSGAAWISRQMALPEQADRLGPARAWAADIGQANAARPCLLSLMDMPEEGMARAARTLRLSCRLDAQETWADALLAAWIMRKGLSMTLPVVVGEKRPSSRRWPWVIGWAAACLVLAWGVSSVNILTVNGESTSAVADSPGYLPHEQDTIHGIIKWPDGHYWQWPLKQDTYDEHE